MEVKQWLVEWLAGTTGKTLKEIDSTSDQSYFELNYIDSFEFISFVSDMEEHFDLQFNNEQFEDRDFMTINGLAHIITGLIVK